MGGECSRQRQKLLMRGFEKRTAHLTPDALFKTPHQKLLPLSRTLVLHLRPNTYGIVFTPCKSSCWRRIFHAAPTAVATSSNTCILGNYSAYHAYRIAHMLMRRVPPSQHKYAQYRCPHRMQPDAAGRSRTQRTHADAADAADAAGRSGTQRDAADAAR